MNQYVKKSFTRPPLLVGTIIFAALLITATTVVRANQTGGTDTSTQTTAKEVKKEWAEAVDAIKGYSLDQRDAALNKADALLISMDSQIEKLESQAQNEWKDLKGDAKANRQAALKSMRQQRAELSEWYGGMKHSSEEAWEEVRTGFVNAFSTLDKSFTDAVGEF